MAIAIALPGVNDLGRKRVENYHNFENSVHAIQHDLQEFITKNIDGESKNVSDVSHIL